MDSIAVEICDAQLIAGNLNLRPSEFYFVRTELTSAGNVYALRATVTVTFHGKTRNYDAGLGLHWLDKFESDLRAGW